MTLKPNNPSHFQNLIRLFENKEIYSYLENHSEVFTCAMREAVSWHYESCPEYRNWLDYNNFKPEDLNSPESLEKLPFIFANIFKTRTLVSILDKDVSLHLTSSGTSGQKSQMFFDDWSIKSPQRLLDWIFEYYNWTGEGQNPLEQPTNYLLYTYEPKVGSKLGTAYTDNYLCQYAKVNKVEYALKNDGNGGHKFDLYGTIKTLKEFEEEGLPVRIFGFPSFLHFTIESLSKLNHKPIKLHKESLVFLGGGWKGNQDKAISKKELYKSVTDSLGIPDHRLRDGFGSVEHCIPYVECEYHNFHIPTASMVFIRDLETFQVLDYGESGYLNFLSPYITSVPANNVLMGDLATKHHHSECPCRLKVDYFKILGRAGIKKNKSCAVSASELLKEFS